MKHVLLSETLIWSALQQETGTNFDALDFDALWEVLQSPNVQGYITQADLDRLYYRIAKEQNVSVAFKLCEQFQRVLKIYTPAAQASIDLQLVPVVPEQTTPDPWNLDRTIRVIDQPSRWREAVNEINDEIIDETTDDATNDSTQAAELEAALALSVNGFLERHSLELLYEESPLTQESSSLLMQWYRRWRQSGFDPLLLFPIALTLTLQKLPALQQFMDQFLTDETAPAGGDRTAEPWSYAKQDLQRSQRQTTSDRQTVSTPPAAPAATEYSTPSEPLPLTDSPHSSTLFPFAPASPNPSHFDRQQPLQGTDRRHRDRASTVPSASLTTTQSSPTNPTQFRTAPSLTAAPVTRDTNRFSPPSTNSAPPILQPNFPPNFPPNLPANPPVDRNLRERPVPPPKGTPEPAPFDPSIPPNFAGNPAPLPGAGFSGTAPGSTDTGIGSATDSNQPPEVLTDPEETPGGPTTKEPEQDIPPDTQPPDTQPPDTQLPDTQPPDTQLPNTQLPNTQFPDTQLPDTQLPDTPDPKKPCLEQPPEGNHPKDSMPSEHSSSSPENLKHDCICECHSDSHDSSHHDSTDHDSTDHDSATTEPIDRTNSQNSKPPQVEDSLHPGLHCQCVNHSDDGLLYQNSSGQSNSKTDFSSPIQPRLSNTDYFNTELISISPDLSLDLNVGNSINETAIATLDREVARSLNSPATLLNFYQFKV